MQTPRTAVKECNEKTRITWHGHHVVANSQVMYGFQSGPIPNTIMSSLPTQERKGLIIHMQQIPHTKSWLPWDQTCSTLNYQR